MRNAMMCRFCVSRTVLTFRAILIVHFTFGAILIMYTSFTFGVSFIMYTLLRACLRAGLGHLRAVDDREEAHAAQHHGPGLEQRVDGHQDVAGEAR